LPPPLPCTATGTAAAAGGPIDGRQRACVRGRITARPPLQSVARRRRSAAAATKLRNETASSLPHPGVHRQATP